MICENCEHKFIEPTPAEKQSAEGTLTIYYNDYDMNLFVCRDCARTIKRDSLENGLTGRYVNRIKKETRTEREDFGDMMNPWDWK